MIRRVLLSVLLASVLLASGPVVSACSTPEAAPPPATTPSAAPTTTATPTTSSGPTLADLQAKADRAALPVDAMADYGIKAPDTDEPDPMTLTMAEGLCAEEPGFTATKARYRMFSGDKILVHSAAFTFQARTGASVIESIAAMGKKCTTWSGLEDFRHKITVNVAVERPPGVDGFFAYCDDVVSSKKEFRYCTVLASLGNTVIEVSPAAHISRADTLQQLRDVLPRAVERLLAA